MTRPTVLIATTQPAMAYALNEKLKADCRKLGLRLESCPAGDSDDEDAAAPGVQVYASAEELFEVLEKRNPIALADTLVVLDLGTLLTEAFEPKASKDESWHVSDNRAGVAVELLLRFPQVFPVFLSPSVPVVETTVDAAEVVLYPARIDTHEGEWGAFHRLQESLCRKNEFPYYRFVSHAFCVPLHFVSPLDGGHGLFSTISRFARGMRCWFDPTGLRTLVKCRFLGMLFGNATNWDNTRDQREVLLARLDNVAVAVDEEREFAMLNAYAAYKFGRRTWIVTTFAEFDTKPLWVPQAPGGAQNLDVVVLRDIDLRFPDIPAEEKIRENLANVSGDASVWKNKYGDSWRIRAVSSHPSVKTEGKFDAKYSDNAYRLGQYGEPSDIHYLGLHKPISTLYDLKSLLKKNNGNDFESVLSRLKTVTDKSKGGGHGAPYLNLAMTESLLRQAGYCENSPAESLLGALLAGEAYELLLGMSKTTALKALTMLHKKEVAAEAGFPGVSGNIDIFPRKKDIDMSLDLLFKEDESTDPRKAKKTKHLFLSRFWADLRPVYRDAELFEPAEAANRESLIYTEWLPQRYIKTILDKVPRGPYDLVLYVLDFCEPAKVNGKRLLVNVATGFWPMSIAAVSMWIFFTTLYALSGLSWDFSMNGLIYLLKLCRDVVLTSLALQGTGVLIDVSTGEDAIAIWEWILLFHIGFSYVLFGLFVSVFYRKITRG